MPVSTPIQIVIDLDSATGPISGLLSANGGQARPFAGWVALAREIDTALASAAESRDVPQDPG